MYILWVGGRVARFFVTQYTKTGKKIPNNQRIPYVHKVCKISLQKFTQLGMFGLKRNHLATLVGGRELSSA
jgi:hypothetical protein